MPTTSFSEVQSFLSCRRKHFYGYSRSLERIETSESLADGKIVHSVLEAYYKCFLDIKQVTHDFAVSVARKTFEESGYEYNPDGNRADMGRMLFDYYFPNEPFAQQGWTILAVEKEFVLEWDSETEERFPFIIDLIARDPHGAIWVIDHKTAYDFKDEAAADLEPQVPLYIAALRALGYPADFGAYNQIRTRKIVGKKTPEFPFGVGPTLAQAMTWTKIPVERQRLVTSFEEQTGVATEINHRKTLPLDVQSKTAFRVANKMVCSNCSFRDLCKAELNGANTDLLERTYYKARERRTFDTLTMQLEDAS